MSARKLGLAKAFRRRPSAGERRLWALLRDRGLHDLKFRRQAPVGRYVVDFLCLERRLIVEADGGYFHPDGGDAERDAWLGSQGFRILRLPNDRLGSRDYVYDRILAILGEVQVASPSPLAGEGGPEGVG